MNKPNTANFISELETSSTEDFGLTRVEVAFDIYTVPLGDTVGDAQVSHCQDLADEGLHAFEWKITLGPKNSAKLLAFLKALEAEPEEYADQGPKLTVSEAAERLFNLVSVAAFDSYPCTTEQVQRWCGKGDVMLCEVESFSRDRTPQYEFSIRQTHVDALAARLNAGQCPEDPDLEIPF